MRNSSRTRGEAELADEIAALVEGMRGAIERELARARAGVRARGAASQPVSPIAEQVIEVMRRTPRGKELAGTSTSPAILPSASTHRTWPRYSAISSRTPPSGRRQACVSAAGMTAMRRPAGRGRWAGRPRSRGRDRAGPRRPARCDEAGRRFGPRHRRRPRRSTAGRWLEAIAARRLESRAPAPRPPRQGKPGTPARAFNP